MASAGTSHIVVPVAAASGALAADRIVVKPTRLKAAYLPDARCVDPAPVLIQSLLVHALQSSAGFRLVSRDDAGLQPDFILLVDLTLFQAEAPTPDDPFWSVPVALTATVIRDADRSIVASKRFEAAANSAADQTEPLIEAFDTATRTVLGATTAWVLRQTP